MNKNTLDKMLKLHRAYLYGKPSGKRLEIHNDCLAGANLSGAILSGADLSGASLNGADLGRAELRNVDLSYAYLNDAYMHLADLSGSNLTRAELINTDLSSATLREANLGGADLSGANLSCAILSKVDLREADLDYADLRCADLDYADLRGANLSGADLTDVLISSNTAGYSMVCPSEGSYIAWKKCGRCIVKLLIPATAKRSSATRTTCRASEAKVLEIQTLKGKQSRIKSVSSWFDPSFVYRVGKTVKVKDFNTDRWAECTNGIHHFLDREEAVLY